MKKTFCTILAFIITSAALIAKETTKFGIITDREVYVSGETLLAKLYVPNDEKSKIVYVDLADMNGKHITGVTTEAKNHQSDVFLKLPDSLSTHTYFIRVFVNEIKEKIFAAQQILVTNRFDGLSNYNEIPVVNAATSVSSLNEKIICSELNKTYDTKTNVSTDIILPEEFLTNLDGDLLICASEIVPEYRFPEVAIKATHNGLSMCEDKGIILQGKVINSITQYPVEGTTVFLTIPDSLPYFQYFKTGIDGKFSFLITDHYEKITAVVQCFQGKGSQPLKIVMKEKYNLKNSELATTNKVIDNELKRYADKTTEIAFMKKLFEVKELSTTVTEKNVAGLYPYYGIPDKTVDPDLFIDLPDFNDISKELLPGVKFRINNDKPVLRVLNSPFRKFFDMSPLLLLDGIPIQDASIIKDMGTKDIDRIDINLSERFYGDLRFAGVVAIYSKNLDKSRLSESDQLVILNIDAIQPAYSLNQGYTENKNIPDLRQTLLWEPNAKPQKVIPVSFNTSEVKGTYRLLIAGRKKTGEQIAYEQLFEVK